MESKRGFFTYIGSAIRIILLLVLVALVTFFTVRFIRNRQDTRRAEEASKTAPNENGDTPQNDAASESSGGTTSDEKQSTGESSSESSSSSAEKSGQIPSGVAESDIPASGGASVSTVPSVGMNSNVFIGACMLSVAAYVLTKKVQKSTNF